MRELKNNAGHVQRAPSTGQTGRDCSTVHDLDQAMMDTRAFWEEKPPENGARMAAQSYQSTKRATAGFQPSQT